MAITSKGLFGAERARGFAAILAASVFWSTSGLVIKLVDWNPLAISGLRSLIAAALLILVTRRLKLPKTKTAWASVVSYTLTMANHLHRRRSGEKHRSCFPGI